VVGRDLPLGESGPGAHAPCTSPCLFDSRHWPTQRPSPFRNGAGASSPAVAKEPYDVLETDGQLEPFAGDRRSELPAGRAPNRPAGSSLLRTDANRASDSSTFI